MAIDLPPHPEALPAEVETLRGSDVLYEGRIGSIAVHVLGDAAFADVDFQAAIEGAESASEAVRRVSSRAYRAGYPAVLVHYAATDEALFIRLAPATVGEIDMPEPVARYFEDLPARAGPLTDEAFERRRVLASVHADRAGQSMEPVFEPMVAPGRMRLLAHPSEADDKAHGLSLALGNPGSRFVGRHYLEADLHAGLASGDRFELGTRDTVQALNDDDDGEGELHERRLEWNRVSRLGLFGIGGRHTEYEFETVLDEGFDLRDLLPFLDRLPLLPDEPLQNVEGRIWKLEAYWQGLLFADFYRRWTVQLQADRTSKSLEADDGGEPLQRELYNSAEISSDYAGSVLVGDASEISYQLALSLRKGIANGDDAVGEADLDYLLWQPRLGLEFAVGDHWLYTFDAIAQFSGDIVPEQQQWVLGGRDRLTAYLPGVAVGDEGALARLQIGYEGLANAPWTFTPLIYAEYGYARDARSDGQDVDLADAGLGLDFGYGDHFEAGLRYARGVYDEGISEARREQAEAQVYFTVALKF